MPDDHVRIAGDCMTHFQAIRNERPVLVALPALERLMLYVLASVTSDASQARRYLAQLTDRVDLALPDAVDEMNDALALVKAAMGRER